MQVRYDSDADAIYVTLRDGAGKTTGDQLDEQRIIHTDATGGVVGVELLFVSRGISLDGLPEADAIAAALRSIGKVVAA